MATILLYYRFNQTEEEQVSKIGLHELAVFHQFKKLLLGYCRQNRITLYSDVTLGKNTKETLEIWAKDCDIFLFWVNGDFFLDDVGINFMNQSVTRHSSNQSVVIPLRGSSVPWFPQELKVAELPALPRCGRFLTTVPETGIASICTEIIEEIAGILKNPQQWRDRANPYRGLEYFDVVHSEWFFGRAQTTRELLAQFRALEQQHQQPRLLVITGPSGSGKSSLARAGLLAALQTSHNQIIFRPDKDCLQMLAVELSEKISKAAGNALLNGFQGSNNHNVLLDMLQRHAGMANTGVKNYVILCDQLEEIFQPGTTADKPELRQERMRYALDNLMHAARSVNPIVSVVFTLRIDYWEELRHLEAGKDIAQALSSQVQPHQCLIVKDAFTEAELLDIIQQPRRRLKKSDLPTDLASALIRQVREQANALPLLEFALTKIWEEEKAQNTSMAVGAENLAGTVAGADPPSKTDIFAMLSEHASDKYRGLSDKQSDIARRLFIRLIHFSDSNSRDTRRRVRMSDLIHWLGKVAGREAVHQVLQEFSSGQTRLLTMTQREAASAGPSPGTPAQHGAAARSRVSRAYENDPDFNTFVEITHEGLISSWALLQQWISPYREYAGLLHDLEGAVQHWDQMGRAGEETWRGERLAGLFEFSTKPEGKQYLSDIELRFLKASRGRQAWKRGASFLLVVISMIVAAVFYYLNLAATKHRLQAERNLRHHFLDLGRSLVVAGNHHEGLAYLQRAQEAWTESESRSTLALLINQSVPWVDSGQDLPGALQDVGRDGWRSVLLSATASPPSARGGTRVLSLSHHGSLRLWHVAGTDGSTPNRRYKTEIVQLQLDKTPISHAVFDPSGAWLLAAGPGGKTQLLETNQGRRLDERTLDGAADSRPLAIALHAAAGTPPVQATEVTSNGIIAQWRRDAARLRWPYAEPLANAAIDASGHRVALATRSGELKLVDLPAADATSGFDMPAKPLSLPLLGQKIGSNQPPEKWLLEFSPNGRWLVRANDRSIHIWDLLNAAIGVSPEGVSAAAKRACSEDGNPVNPYSCDENSGVRHISYIAHDETITSIQISGDNRYLLTTSVDRTARTWPLQEGSRQGTFVAYHPAAVTAARFGGDSSLILTVSRDVRLWNANGAQLLGVWQGRQAPITKLSVGSNDDLAVTGAADGELRLWSKSAGWYQRSLRLVDEQDDGAVLMKVALVKEGLLSADPRPGKAVRFFKIAPTGFDTGQALRHGPEFSGSELLTLSPASDRALMGGSDGYAEIWDLQPSPRLRCPLPAPQRSAYTSAAFAPDGRTLVTTQRTGEAWLWSVPDDGSPCPAAQHLTGQPPASEDTKVGEFSSDGEWVVTTHSSQAWVFHRTASGQLQPVHQLNQQDSILAARSNQQESILAARFVPDRATLVTASRTRIKLWELAQGTAITTLTSEGNPLESPPPGASPISISRDGRRLLSIHNDSTVRVWDLTTPNASMEPLQLSGHRRRVTAASFFFDQSEHVISVSEDGNLRLFETTSGRLLAQLGYHSGPIEALALGSPDSGLLATSSPDSSTKLWRIQGDLRQSPAQLERIVRCASGFRYDESQSRFVPAQVAQPDTCHEAPSQSPPTGVMRARAVLRQVLHTVASWVKK